MSYLNRNLEGGDIINWDNAEWNAENMVKKSVENHNDICQGNKLGLVPFPIPMNYSASLALCFGVRGAMSLIKDKEEDLAVVDQTRKHESCKSKLF